MFSSSRRDVGLLTSLLLLTEICQCRLQLGITLRLFTFLLRPWHAWEEEETTANGDSIVSSKCDRDRLGCDDAPSRDMPSGA